MNDVSADADPNTGAAILDSYGAGGWVQVGGTSLSAPLIAAVYALAGNASTWSYPAQSVYDSPGSLHDVTTGDNDNGSCPMAAWCNAGSGYDLPTGIGTPNGLGGF
jgi:subtilase family serine protease